MTALGEMAKLIRSKNAGPFLLTFDIMFDDPKIYKRVKSSGKISSRIIADVYQVDEADVQFFFVDSALAIKATIPRRVFQGEVGDNDGHGGQQYAPLIGIDI